MIIFSDCGRKLSIEEITSLEKKLGVTFSEDIKNYYLKHNGGTPEPDTFPATDEYEPIIISSFLSMKEDSSGGGTLEETYEKGISKGYLPNDLVPFAVDWGNNYLCFDSMGKVYFFATDSWFDDLSTEENINKNKRLLCDTFNQFINSLVDEDEAY